MNSQTTETPLKQEVVQLREARGRLQMEADGWVLQVQNEIRETIFQVTSQLQGEKMDATTEAESYQNKMVVLTGEIAQARLELEEARTRPTAGLIPDAVPTEALPAPGATSPVPQSWGMIPPVSW